MDKGVVTEIVDLAKAPHKLEAGGVPYLAVPAGWTAADARKPKPAPATLRLHTLAGLKDYLDANRDKLDLGTHLLHIASHQRVALLSAVHGDMAQRDAILEVVFEPLFGDPSFKFGVWYALENFNICLQTLFVPDTEVERILRVTGTVKESDVRETADDGVTQAVTASRGVHLRSEVSVPNPVTLRPYRTFREVEQPASRFVLRLKSGQSDGPPQAALFEADGGAWRLTAIEGIARWLRTAQMPYTLAIIG